MATDTISFLKNIIGCDRYDEFRCIAIRYIPIASIFLIVVFALTYFFYWSVLSWILNLITGTSLIFVAYIAGLVLLLDKGVTVELERDRYNNYKFPKEKPKGYKVTKIWGIILVILAILAIYFSNKYRKNYAFKCETFLVDENNGVYHLNGSCDEKSKQYTTQMKGYEIDEHGYTLCEICKDWASDTQDFYESEQFTRR